MKISARLKDFRDPDVRRKQYIKKTCPGCGEIFDLPPYVAKRWRHCSHSCASSIVLVGLKKAPRENRKCPICGRIYTRTEKDALAGRKATCSFECGIRASSINRRKSEFGSAPNVHRENLRRIRPMERCELCGWDSEPNILQMHHMDGDDKNGNPENLKWLCPNCHSREHFRSKTGWYASTRNRVSTSP
jgi:hypothetical protein